MCLGSCPFDFVSAGRNLLVFFFFLFFMWIRACVGSTEFCLMLSLIALMWSVRLICCRARAHGSLRRFTSEGVNVQAYGGNELSATDSVLQTRRVEHLISAQEGGRGKRHFKETEVVRKSEGQPIR